MKRKPVTSAAIGAQAHDARTTAGLSQTELGKRIGASRFWVAEFEKGKPTVELGLALRALQTLGLAIRIEPDAEPRSPGGQSAAVGDLFHVNTATPSSVGPIIAAATLTSVAPSRIMWPAAQPAAKHKSK
jgi:DNA-binding XRE family transcriptional regulator